MRILIIQTAFIGDVVLTTPLLVKLAELYPMAELHVVSTPQGCEILAGLPGVITHALNKKKDGVLKGMRKLLDSMGRDKQFDLVLSVHRSLRSLAIGRKVRAKHKIAFRSFWAKFFGYETVAYPHYDEAIHYADKPLALLEPLGARGGPRPAPKLAVSNEDSLKIRDKLATLGSAASGGYIVLSPFSVWGTKTWFADRFARVGAEVSKRYGKPVVLVGSSGNLELVTAGTIAEKINASGGRAVSLVGQTSLGELKALIRGASLVVANDSAPVHIAAAFQIPTVAVFGPTVKKWGFFPLSERSVVVERSDVPCRPCHIHGPQKCPRGHFRCMDEIQVEDVVTAIDNLFR